ncbi:disease resistance protein RGA2-like [Vigna radiata var. radiata]|uniref:Disease resistance protein RGA2-like n=1 Tax=Vigna radiata var. radiata TaxID=3916 RepID=A0A1S3UYX5_VIGRR|nr:disease resistance protein RGA2-like [Vigna radiata var. radiata]
MAESLIVAVAESLITKLASRVVEQASLALGVHQELQQMKKTMALVKAFLLDAEQKKQQNNALSEWLRQIRQVFAHAEDIVDNFECEVLRKHVVSSHGSFCRKVCRLFSTSNPVVYRYRMGREIKGIKKQLEKVATDGHMFGLQSSDKDTKVLHAREMTHSHVNVSNVVGREHDKQKIIELLLQDDHHDRSLSVISIVGFGGLGKTTLAKVVFNDTAIEECFTLKMWVCVSNDFELRNVLMKILNSAPNPTNEKFKNLDTDQLQIRLRSCLQREKFLLVLDDVWNEDRVKWDELKEIIEMVGNKGSKILVTTRSHSINAMMRTKSSNSYILKGLSEEDSMSLFVKSAFDDGEGKNHPELMEIGRQIVRKCGGIPLAVRTLGSSLFSRVDRKEWENIRDNEIWNLKQNENDILPALELSYDQLPSHLKRCFACFSLTSKDFDVSSSYVALLWEALGFLSAPKQNETTHDVANEYLRELWSRSFLTDFLDMGSTCRFKLHDLVRDLAVYVAKGEFQILYPHSTSISEHAQHLSFIENDMLGQDLVPIGARTIIFPMEATNDAFLNTLVSRCKYLRVLDLSYSEYESLPSCIGKLKHLRYLNLSGNKKLKGLPNSVCKLQNLQTLDLRGCIKLQKLPKGIRKLISLRRLLVTTRQPDFPDKEISKLASMETVELYSCDNLESLFQAIQPRSLKFLHLSGCGGLKSLSFHVITNLESLVIFKCSKMELSMGLSNLNSIPDSRLKLLVLQSLPQLVTLPQWLQGSVNTLHSLLLVDCNNLEELPEWLSTLNCLKLLIIEHCPKLISLPDTTHRLRNLEHLEINDCPELCKRCQPGVGLDWHKISHIKQVIIGEPEE